MKSRYHIIFISLIASLLISCSEKPLIHLYVDGNNNTYRITPEKKLIYEPVTPEMSSSGVYSGGNPKEVMLNKEDYKKLTGLINSTFKNKKVHTEARNMGTGMVKLIFLENRTQTAFINSDSEEKKQLEKVLGELMAK
jgi:hypothetical protein